MTSPLPAGVFYCPVHGDLLDGPRSMRCERDGHEFAAFATPSPLPDKHEFDSPGIEKLRERAVDAIAWALIDNSMDTADRQPSGEVYRAAVEQARALLPTLAPSPLPTDEDAREKANHEPIQAGDAIALLDSLPTRAVVMDGSGEVWRKLGTGKWDRLDSDGGEPAEISSTVVWQSLPPTVEVLHPAGFRRSVVSTPSDEDSDYSITDSEWRDFRSAPDHEDSHRAWVDRKIRERMFTFRADYAVVSTPDVRALIQRAKVARAAVYHAAPAVAEDVGNLLTDLIAALSAPPTITDETVERWARPIHELVYAPGASFDRASEESREYIRACTRAVLEVAGERVATDAQTRIDELVAWIDQTLAKPVFNPPTSDFAKDTVADYKSWRRLLLNGLHPSARAALRAALGGEEKTQ